MDDVIYEHAERAHEFCQLIMLYKLVYHAKQHMSMRALFKIWHAPI